MDHDIESEFHGEIELRPEGIGLSSFPSALGDESFLISAALRQQGGVDGGNFRWLQLLRNMVIVDSCLPDRNDLGMEGQFPKRREKFQSFLDDICRMDADNGINIRETLGESDSPATTLKSRADGDDPCDRRILGPGDYLLEISPKIRIIEMGVCLDQFHGEIFSLLPFL